LFRGRGDHPKTGTLKKRVQPEQITLNLGVDAIIPKPPKGHRWASVVHDQTATWLATWKENVNGATKYVFLAATSAWKGQSDMQKFEKARNLKNFVGKIRKTYNSELRDKLSEVRQRATAMYLIDQLALRAGNEKGDDEADTVGCCSLRWEHITLEPPNTLNFDFLGKDSIRYQNSVEVLPQVYKNIGIFKKQVGKGNMIFDRLTVSK
jgi:DNA topoisomerase-1